ncbi:calcium uptake protein 1 homolog, mitochondrial [Eurytemora carolleeae]|uniref:calcium uptake protein 1 homolog, mitochondrial n=1 Tax=Eurytemora carolleeae TaxID=1294199 RepID=UPI000C78C86B|nr:calcium uptake protein 1 homolog, mitochondrial [Eurytemora carolleeae]|eukprot:XP_023321981.1 calcium uptake protein 1 homolog, mitochondrial-like [Eurytemora affinis]
MELLAESAENTLVAAENRVRQFSTPDKIFNYFASYQFVNKKNGRKSMMMTPLEFYSSVTPDCRRVHGVGPGVHVEVDQQELDDGKVVMERSPISGSVLNEIGKLGLLSYQDFCFLLALISTPKRYIETTFNMFDVTGDGHIEAKEFAYVSTKMAHKSGGFGSYTDTDQEEILASSSGLLNYLFGKNRDQSLTKEKFKKLQTDLLDEIVQLEFREYDTENTGRISEADFVNFLLKNGKLMPKKRAQLIKKVQSRWPAKGRGVSLPSFKSFFMVLAGGQELERALFFLDVEGTGVDKEEFRKISSWVSQTECSDHVVELIYEMLDDDEDGRLYRDDIAQILLDWRHSRGFAKGGIQVSLGQLSI